MDRPQPRLPAWSRGFAAACGLAAAGAAACPGDGVRVQVLGSGGPELAGGRAAASYLIWDGPAARVLVDAGPGARLNFGRTGARFADLDVVLLTHLHVDHSADLPAFVKAGFFGDRDRPLPLYAPAGNRLMPPPDTFTARLFGGDGAFRYLAEFVEGPAAWRLEPRVLPIEPRAPFEVQTAKGLAISAAPVHHGPLPALAYRVELGGRSVVFSGDMNGDYDTLPALARGADLLVAHHAIPEGAGGAARNLHMPPSVIGRIAAQAEVGALVLGHRMTRTLGREAESLEIVRRAYGGPVSFAEDLDCFAPAARSGGDRNAPRGQTSWERGADAAGPGSQSSAYQASGQ